jgi:hypothetical protein
VPGTARLVGMGEGLMDQQDVHRNLSSRAP